MCNLVVTTAFGCWDSQTPDLGSNTDYLLLGMEISHVRTIMVTGAGEGLRWELGPDSLGDLPEGDSLGLGLTAFNEDNKTHHCHPPQRTEMVNIIKVRALERKKKKILFSLTVISPKRSLLHMKMASCPQTGRGPPASLASWCRPMLPFEVHC